MGSVGSTLNDRYRLDRKIGEGGFASVFLATDLELGRQVAIKVLEQNWASDKNLLARFRTEARAVAALDYPNILVIYDFGVVRGAPYLVMPYVGGGTLADRMKRERLTLDEIGFYLDQIGSALDYAHQRGIIHRDIKPTNLLIRSDGQLVLMDFGLAKLLDNVSLEAQTVVMGTVAYMAPEQCQGMVSAASDIYMLGVLLYQMLAGKLPYEGNTTKIMVEHVYAAPGSLMEAPTMQSVSPNVVKALDQVLTKVLAKRPADRYPTCQALSYAYYEALKADPMRSARNYGPNKNPHQQQSDETLVDKQLVVSPTSMESSRGGRGKPPHPTSTPPPPLLDGARGGRGEPPPPLLDEAITPDAAERKKILVKPARLLVTTEPDKGFRAVFDLTGETLTLGRAQDNNLCVPLAIISRYHVVFNRLNSELQEPSYKIVQCKTINPLRFRGNEVVEKVLENGDTIEIGKRGYAEYIVKLTYQTAEYGFV